MISWEKETEHLFEAITGIKTKTKLKFKIFKSDPYLSTEDWILIMQN
jgi:hypothetical protein